MRKAWRLTLAAGLNLRSEQPGGDTLAVAVNTKGVSTQDSSRHLGLRRNENQPQKKVKDLAPKYLA